MRKGKAPCSLRDHRHGLPLVERTVPRNLSAEVDPGHILGDEVVDIAIVASIVSRHDILVAELPEHLDLPLKCRLGMRVCL